MAPKAAKRPATSGASKGKRARSSREVEEQCKQVATALGAASGSPSSVLRMLSACSVHAMSIYKEERHATQAQVVTWIGEALGGLKADLDKTVAEANASLEAAQADVGLREAAVAEREAALKALAEARAAAAAALAEAEGALTAAEEELARAEAARATGEGEIEAATSRKAEVEGLRRMFAELKAAPSTKRSLGSFVSRAKKQGVDKELLKAAPGALGKAADSRTDFDGIVLTSIDAALQRRVAELNETIANGDASKAQLSATVETARQAVATAQEHSGAAAAKSFEAVAAAKAGERAVKEAKQAHKSGRPAVREAEAATKTATASARHFKSGPLAAYEALRDRTAPAPEAEEFVEAVEPALAA